MATGELESLFTVGLKVSKQQSNTHVHPRFDEFKCRHIKSGDQDYRRKQSLERQKTKRFNAQQFARKLADGDLDLDIEDGISTETSKEEEMDTVDAKEKNVMRTRRNPYKNQLMLSEWLIDAPDDLEDDWVMVVCPTGKRTLVVAHKGTTTAYSKSGHVFSRFPSLLPGGSFKTWRKDKAGSSAFTILDCIYDEVQRTYWMIDLMCYNGTALYDSETDFRFFWLNTKLIEECGSIHERSSINPNIFRPCPHVSCLEVSLNEALAKTHPFTIDGLLFYHRLSHYERGRTPLVGWLKPYMLPDILNIPVPPNILDEAPVEFNRHILKEANKKLQNTTSDRSFNNPAKKVYVVKMET